MVRYVCLTVQNVQVRVELPHKLRPGAEASPSTGPGHTHSNRPRAQQQGHAHSNRPRAQQQGHAHSNRPHAQQQGHAHSNRAMRTATGHTHSNRAMRTATGPCAQQSAHERQPVWEQQQSVQSRATKIYASGTASGERQRQPCMLPVALH